jgi:hypothetical protein
MFSTSDPPMSKILCVAAPPWGAILLGGASVPIFVDIIQVYVIVIAEWVRGSFRVVGIANGKTKSCRSSTLYPFVGAKPRL